VAREKGADRELVEKILRTKRSRPELRQKEIASLVGTSQKTVSRVIQVEKHHKAGEARESIALGDVSNIWVQHVINTVERLDSEARLRGATSSAASQQHILDLSTAARRLGGEAEAKTGLARMGWPPPMEHEWSLDVETEVLGKCLTEHLKDTEVARVLAQWKEAGRRFSAKAWALVGDLEKQYPTGETIGPTPPFVHSVYNEASLRAGGSPGTSDRYQPVEQEGYWWLWRGAYGIARAANRDDLEPSERLHREAILKGQGDPRVRQLVNLVNEVRRLGEQVHEQLLVLALKREFPGRCQACPDVR